MADIPLNVPGERQTDDQGLWLDEEAFCFANTFFFFLLGVFIIWSRKIQLWIKRDDIIGLAQTTAAMAAISLAIVTVLQEKRSRERYTRAVLWLITAVFVVATCSGWLDVLTRNPSSEKVEPLVLHVTIGVGVFCFAWGGGYFALYSLRRNRGPAVPLQYHVGMMMVGMYVVCIP